jgi:hypothetical protein
MTSLCDCAFLREANALRGMSDTATSARRTLATRRGSHAKTPRRKARQDQLIARENANPQKQNNDQPSRLCVFA